MLVISPFSGYKLWTPGDLEVSPRIWLDANDEGSVTLVDGKISQWSDKSGNDRHLYQASTSRQPTYITGATNVIEIDNIDDVLSSDINVANEIMGNQDFMAFLVSFGTNQVFGVGGNSLNGGGAIPRLYMQRSVFSYNNNFTVTINAPSGGNIITYQHDGVTTASAWLNGLSKGEGTEPVVATFGGQGYLSVPLYASGVAQTGQIGEFIVTSPSETIRQKLEGYLAHKWGLTANLPITHPYKNTPPYVY